MKPTLFLPIGFLFIFFTSFGQSPKTNDELASSYFDYFQLNREIPFLHLNKNVLVPNEELWFAAYVFDSRIFQPNLETTNLLLEVFNSSGEHMETQTLFIHAGKGTGHLQLNPKIYKEGNYFIKASTRYMENFREDLEYVTHFTILSSNQENQEKQEKASELHILPEGGHLLLDQQNLVGVKVIDEMGDGIVFTKARLVDQGHNLITSFKSNRFGMGKFNFTPEPGKTYTLLIIDEFGREINKSLPAAKIKGMNLTTNFVEDNLMISIRTNSESIPEIENKNYTLAVHQEGKMKQFQFSFPKNKTVAPIAIPKDSLYSGVNILTIFDEELVPIVERQIFNYDLKRIGVDASFVKKNGDSLEIGLKSKTENLAPNSISISVLPAATESVNASHNILSAFYLKPYLKGNIQDAPYYFSNEIEQRRREYDLDLLLLTQGWSKYSWNNIFKHPPEEYKRPEEGFTIRGQLTTNKDLKGENLFVVSEDSGLFQILEIGENNSFEAKNIFLIDSSSISIGLPKGYNNRIIKPKGFANVLVDQSKPFIKNENLKILGKTKPVVEKYILKDFIEKGEALDTVYLEGRSKTKQQIREMMDPTGNTHYIDDETSRQYMFLTEYIRSRGFLIVREFGVLYIVRPRFRRTFNALSDIENGSGQPVILLDGTRLQDYEILDQMMLSEIKSIYIKKYGAGERGILNIAGVIKIETKRGKDFDNSALEETTFKLIAENGYAPTKEYYAPKYKNYNNPLFTKFGAIQWLDDIFLDQDGLGSFKILNTMQPEIKLIIEGMTEKGDLISEVILLETDRQLN
jgi:hypothetical protein